MAETTSKVAGRWGGVVLVIFLAVGVTVGSALFTYYLILGEVSLPFSGKGDVATGPIVKLGEFMVNFGSPDRIGYARFAVELELYEKKGVDMVEKRMAALRNAVILYIRDCTYDDFGSSASLRQVAEALMDRLNSILPTPMIADLYFVEFAVQ